MIERRKKACIYLDTYGTQFEEKQHMGLLYYFLFLYLATAMAFADDAMVRDVPYELVE